MDAYYLGWTYVCLSGAIGAVIGLVLAAIWRNPKFDGAITLVAAALGATGNGTNVFPQLMRETPPLPLLGLVGWSIGAVVWLLAVLVFKRFRNEPRIRFRVAKWSLALFGGLALVYLLLCVGRAGLMQFLGEDLFEMAGLTLLVSSPAIIMAAAYCVAGVIEQTRPPSKKAISK